MTTWHELARASQALPCGAAALRQQSRELVREVREAVGRAQAVWSREASGSPGQGSGGSGAAGRLQ
jgi:hypothetical protein